MTLNGKPPYLDLPSIGWENSGNSGRGYPQGRFRGNNMLYLEGEYRFNLTSTGLLGGVLFVYASSFSNQQNAFQRVLPGYGLGLRIKFKKNINLGEVF